MAKIQCNVISYTLMRTVDIDVILPSVTIPESMGMSGENLIMIILKNIQYYIFYMDLVITMHNGVAIQV